MPLVRDYMTDAELEARIAEMDSPDYKGFDDPQHGATNKNFFLVLTNELAWRTEHNKHYTEDQRRADTLAHHQHVLNRRAAGDQQGYIPPERFWWQD
jgi:hypothetical protein